MRCATFASCALLVVGACDRATPAPQEQAKPRVPGKVIELAEPARVVVEAEAGAVDSPFEVIVDELASGGRCIVLPEEWHTHKELHPALRSKADGTPVSKEAVSTNPLNAALVPNGSVILKFSVPKLATYAFWARANFHCSCADSIYYSIDSEGPVDTDGNGEYDERDPQTLYGSTHGKWKWFEAKSRVTLAQGEHTLGIYNREDGVKIDQIMFAEIPASPLDPYVPQGIEKSHD
jgi:hypothetical protein